MMSARLPRLWPLVVVAGCATVPLERPSATLADAGVVATVDEVLPLSRSASVRWRPDGLAVLGEQNASDPVYAERHGDGWVSWPAPGGTLIEDRLLSVSGGGSSVFKLVGDVWEQVPGADPRLRPLCAEPWEHPLRIHCGDVVAPTKGTPRATTEAGDGHWLMAVIDEDDWTVFRFVEFKAGAFAVSPPQRPGVTLVGSGGHMSRVVAWRGKRTLLFEQIATHEEILGCWEPGPNGQCPAPPCQPPQPIPLINGQRPPHRTPPHYDGSPPVAQVEQPVCDSRTTETRRLLLLVEGEPPVDASALIGGPQVLVRTRFTGFEPSRPFRVGDEGRSTSLLAARGNGDTLQLVISRVYVDGPLTSEEVRFIEGKTTTSGTAVLPTFIDLNLAR